MSALTLRGGLVLDDDGAVRERDVHIADGRLCDRPSAAARVVDVGGQLITPGLVNTHHHSNEAWLRGRYDALPLEPWMLFSYPAIGAVRASAAEVRSRTLLSGLALLQGGSTCVVDFLFEPGGFSDASIDAVIDAYRALGLRVVLVLGMADLAWRETVIADFSLAPAPALARLDAETPPSWEQWERLARDAVARHHDPAAGVHIALGPSGPQRCSDEMLRGCALLAEELDLGIHMHVLETRMQQATALERRGGLTLPAYLDALGALSPRVTFEHAIWLQESDIELMAARGVAVSHNPASNLKLGSGVCPVPALVSAGIPVGLGTDGTSSSDGAQALADLRLAALLHRGPETDPQDWLGARAAWAMATREGGRVAGVPGLGTLRDGAPADLLVFALQQPAFTPLNDPLLHLVYSTPRPAAALVAGRWVMRDGHVTGVDEAEILAQARVHGADALARQAAIDAEAETLFAAVMAGWRACRPVAQVAR